MKLDYIKLGLFKIKKKLLPVIFKLELPRDSRIYLVFHAALLEIAPLQTLVQATLQAKEEKKYEVKEILDSRETRKG